MIMDFLPLVSLLTCLIACARADFNTLQHAPSSAEDDGSFWPLPKAFEWFNDTLVIRPGLFRFKFVSGEHNCRILNEAFKRYSNIILKSQSLLLHYGHGKEHRSQHDVRPHERVHSSAYLDELEVHFSGICETLPYFGMVEAYRLEVNSVRTPGSAILSSRSVWGILRGLETFSQLLDASQDGSSLVIRSVSVDDKPRFSHRGLLIDTSRHFLPIKTIQTILDGMEYNKLNVLHWHIVDDQSFPYQSEAFPALSEKGAYDSRYLIYTNTDIQGIITYASQRGIRVLPEFDTPGHTLSWGPGQPGFLTKCNGLSYEYGPVNPINEDNYVFLKQLFNEIFHLFPDGYLHLGGDEVDFTCWASNPEIKKFMDGHNMTGDYEKLESYYIKKLVDIVEKQFHSNTIVWQEVFDNGVELYNSTIVHAWKGFHEIELFNITEAGHKALLSSCWYLDHLSTGGDWWKYYDCDPWSFDGTDDQKKLVIGGEACMWGEVVDETNVVQRIFPRASATAEKLWSPQTDKNTYNRLVSERIEKHTCRMRQRGIPAQPPNGPGYCLI